MTGAGISRLSLTGSSRAAKEGGIDKAQAAQIGSFETASLHVGFAQAGFDEARLPEVAFPKIGLRQVDAVQRRPVKKRPGSLASISSVSSRRRLMARTSGRSAPVSLHCSNRAASSGRTTNPTDPDRKSPPPQGRIGSANGGLPGVGAPRGPAFDREGSARWRQLSQYSQRPALQAATARRHSAMSRACSRRALAYPSPPLRAWR